MRRRTAWIMAWLTTLSGVVIASEGDSDAEPVDRSSPGVFRGDDDVARLASTVDRRLAEKTSEAGIEPAKPATDAEFLRRVTLDIVGRIPTVAEARAFLDDSTPGKRRALVERLLASPGYANHFTDVWRGLLLPNLDEDFTLKYFSPNLESWLRRKFAEGTPYDAMVREVLTTPLGQGRTPSPYPYEAGVRPSPLAFYASNDAKPENLAASSSRIFLGIRIECAQCHDHPFAAWKRDQFWSTAAFFAGIERPKQVACDFFQAREVPERRELAVSGGPKLVPRPVPRRVRTPMAVEFATSGTPGRLGRRPRQSVLRPSPGQPGLVIVLRDRSGRPGRRPRSAQPGESSRAARRAGPGVRLASSRLQIP